MTSTEERTAASRNGSNSRSEQSYGRPPSELRGYAMVIGVDSARTR
jgi:hypothetical protein